MRIYSEDSASTWAIILDMRDPETGKRRRRWRSFRWKRKIEGGRQ
jgi:hypothetical protein